MASKNPAAGVPPPIFTFCGLTEENRRPLPMRLVGDTQERFSDAGSILEAVFDFRQGMTPWAANTKLTYSFVPIAETTYRNNGRKALPWFGNNPAEYERQKKFVRQAFDNWEPYMGSISFQEITGNWKSALIRIQFGPAALGSNSYVGSYNASIKTGYTMTLGWDVNQAASNRNAGTAEHEIGHALGLDHEQQNPSGGFRWNHAVVYEYFRLTNGWNQEVTDNNVLNLLTPSQVAFSDWDGVSIMQYALPSPAVAKDVFDYYASLGYQVDQEAKTLADNGQGLFFAPAAYAATGIRHNATLSDHDKKMMLKLYGDKTITGAGHVNLEVDESMEVDETPAQLDFDVADGGKYSIKVAGKNPAVAIVRDSENEQIAHKANFDSQADAFTFDVDLKAGETYTLHLMATTAPAGGRGKRPKMMPFSVTLCKLGGQKAKTAAKAKKATGPQAASGPKKTIGKKPAAGGKKTKTAKKKSAAGAK